MDMAAHKCILPIRGAVAEVLSFFIGIYYHYCILGRFREFESLSYVTLGNVFIRNTLDKGFILFCSYMTLVVLISAALRGEQIVSFHQLCVRFLFINS
jgi:hypothetical protein